ncbi:hypothetical protein [Chryseobacterium oryctis]|uniref:YD repeat-containing protein n=1 Tax=Chryseobacterium oryctis TaxID=2952618 RepID=A0ABT3HLU5_9FLAO|nr:hypothetical protein [Chryseobacterium oryctis]MCW3160739.1 hypothetical protein [Chryseobacterium oryctis]
MKKIILSGSISLLILSCSSDNNTVTDNTDPTQQNVILPVKMSIDGETMKINYDGTKITNLISTSNSGNKLVFEYNGDLISSIKFYEGNVLQTAQEYTYNSNNLLAKAVNKEYASNGITIQYSTTNTYTHINSNSITVKREMYSPTPQPVMNTTYTYNNGNIVGSTGSGSLTYNGVTTNYNESSTYTFTDKNYPFKNVKGFDKLVHTDDRGDGLSFLFSNIKNNISSYKSTTSWTSPSGTGTSFSSYKYTTTFNTAGYPIYESRNSLDANGNPDMSQPEIHTYEYNH